MVSILTLKQKPVHATYSHYFYITTITSPLSLSARTDNKIIYYTISSCGRLEDDLHPQIGRKPTAGLVA